MTKPEALIELAARCEQASGPDRQLDARITYAVHPLMHRLGSVEDYLGTSQSRKAPAYTASLDAALTLVPKGCTWRLDFLADRHGQGSCGSCFVLHPPGQMNNGDAATPPLALTAAALRALAREG